MTGTQPQLLFTTRSQWRNWLEKNHNRSPGIWMIFYKKHAGGKSVSYDDAVEEALCFGWVDSLVRKLDADRYIQKFTPRKEKALGQKATRTGWRN